LDPGIRPPKTPLRFFSREASPKVELVLGLGGGAGNRVEDAVVATDSVAAQVEGPVHWEEDAVVVDGWLVVHPRVRAVKVDDVSNF
jgi:hypothetical protein